MSDHAHAPSAQRQQAMTEALRAWDPEAEVSLETGTGRLMVMTTLPTERVIAILKEAGEARWEKTRVAAVDPAREQAAIEERKALGITMLEPFSEADVSRFVASSEKAWAALAESAGPKGVENYRRMKEAIAKLNP